MVAVTKNHISFILYIVLKNRSNKLSINEIRIRQELPVGNKTTWKLKPLKPCTLELGIP